MAAVSSPLFFSKRMTSGVRVAIVSCDRFAAKRRDAGKPRLSKYIFLRVLAFFEFLGLLFGRFNNVLFQ